MGHFVDLKTWNRREHYALFRKYAQPFFSVTVELDVTNVWKRSRTAGAPFFLATLFFMHKAVNGTEALRLRIRRRGVWLHDRVGIGSTIARRDDTYGFARIDPETSLEAFVTSGNAAIAVAASRKRLEFANQSDDIVYQSSLPWLRFTAFSNALPTNDSIPRIAFGACHRVGRRVKMPVAVEVHHALVDGRDVARFLERFQAELDRNEGGPR